MKICGKNSRRENSGKLFGEKSFPRHFPGNLVVFSSKYDTFSGKVPFAREIF